MDAMTLMLEACNYKVAVKVRHVWDQRRKDSLRFPTDLYLTDEDLPIRTICTLANADV